MHSSPGYTMVYAFGKLINFAHGELFMLGFFWSYLVDRKRVQRAPKKPLAWFIGAFFAGHGHGGGDRSAFGPGGL